LKAELAVFGVGAARVTVALAVTLRVPIFDADEPVRMIVTPVQVVAGATGGQVQVGQLIVPPVNFNEMLLKI
jgi:hypothetical protein